MGNALGPQTNLGNSITFFDQNPLSPYMQRWELSIQRELGSGLSPKSSYIGNRGTHIEVTRNINATPNEFLSTSPSAIRRGLTTCRSSCPIRLSG